MTHINKPFTLTLMEECGFVLSMEQFTTEEDMNNAFSTVVSVAPKPYTTTTSEDGLDTEVTLSTHRVCTIHNS